MGPSMRERDYYTAYPRPILWLVPGGEATWNGATVEIEPFYLSKLPVTNEQFEAFDPGFERSATSPGDRDPAVCVSWRDAAEYCSWYAEVARKPIRLPTEVEWEYACRAGAAGPCPGPGDDVDGLAWHGGNSGADRVPPLDGKPTNGFGLHALLGGVWEWTGSAYVPEPVTGGPAAEARDADPGAPRVLRGGSFRTSREELSCSRRRGEEAEARFDDAGFRIARSFRG